MKLRWLRLIRLGRRYWRVKVRRSWRRPRVRRRRRCSGRFRRTVVATFSDDTTDAGNTTGTLTITGAVVGESGYEYRAVFMNGVGFPVMGTPATLTVDEAPVVTTNPVGQTVLAGKGAMFTAAASGAPTPTMQWQVSTNFGSTWINDTTDAGNTTVRYGLRCCGWREWSGVPRSVHERGWSPSAEYAGDIDGRRGSGGYD